MIKNIAEILDSANILDVVMEFCQLKKSGNSYKACCPIHAEKTPSFIVSPSKNIFKCFGCGAGGDSVAFLKAYKKMDFIEAVRYIAEKNNIPIIEERSDKPDPGHDARQRMRATLGALQAHFIVNKDDKPNIGQQYFIDRGFTQETIDLFGVGYCDGSKPPGIDDAALIDAGVLNPETKNLTFYKRAIIPLHDKSGAILSFAGRTLEAETKGLKYINGRNVENGFQKGQFLFNWHRARREFRKTGVLWIVEGYADAMALTQAGQSNVVALCGTEFTDVHAAMIAEEAKKIESGIKKKYYLFLDSDEAGINKTYGTEDQRGLIERFAKYGQVVVIQCPVKDAAEYLNTPGKNRVETLLENHALDGVEDLIKTWIGPEFRDMTAWEKGDLQNKVARLLSRVWPENVRDIYINDLSTNIGLTPRELASMVKRHLSNIESGVKNRVGDEFQYLKVADTYLQRVPQFNIRTKAITISYTQRKVSELEREKGKNFANQIPRFVDFITLPNHLEYQRTFALECEGTTHQYFNQYEPLPFPAKEFELPKEFYDDIENFDYQKIPEIKNTIKFFKHVFDHRNYGNQYLKLGLDWVALCYLNPMQRLPALALVSSEEGTGKSTFINLMSAIFGLNLTKTEAVRITKSFNAMMANKLMIVVEETNDQKGEIENLLKDLITSFEKVVEYKHRDAKVIQSFDKFIFASNHEDSFMKVGTETTRFFVMKLHKITDKEKDFEDKLYREIPYFLYFLQRRGVLTPDKDRLWFDPKLFENENLLKLRQASKDISQQMLEQFINAVFLRTGLTHVLFKAGTEWIAKMMSVYGGQKYKDHTNVYWQKVCVNNCRLRQKEFGTRFKQLIFKGIHSDNWTYNYQWDYEWMDAQTRFIEFPIWKFVRPEEIWENFDKETMYAFCRKMEENLGEYEKVYGDAPTVWLKEVLNNNNKIAI